MTPDRTADFVAETAAHARDGRDAAVARPVPRFPAVRHLASGGLGDVFVAQDAELPREVALKQIQARRADDERARAEFVREARLTGALEHPGIVPVYGVGTAAGGHPYYAMRLIAGETLRCAIDRFHTQAGGDPRSLGFRQLLGRFIAVCQAIEYAHSRGVIHRDLKPDNVMLGAFGETLVVDWGLAKRISEVDAVAEPVPATGHSSIEPTNDGDIKGTFAYMAPEQAAGDVQNLGPACDIFALGGVLFTLLTGELPTGERNRLEILVSLSDGQIRAPRDGRPRVPAALDAVCRKAMAHRPGDRYAKAAELAADVERWLADEPVSAFRAPLPERVARWARKHPGTVSGVGASLAVGLVALAVGLTVVGGKNAELRASEARATARFDMAKEAVEKYLTEVTDDEEMQQRGLHALRKRLLETAVPFYKRLTAEGGDTAELREAQAGGHFRLGSIAEDLGDSVTAEREYQAAIALWGRLAADYPNLPAHLSSLAQSSNNLGNVLSATGDATGALRAYSTALTHQERLIAEHPAVPEYRSHLAKHHQNIALAMHSGGDATSALREYRAALTLQERLAADYPTVPEYRSSLAGTYYGLGNLLSDTENAANALQAYRAALALQERLAADHPAISEYRNDLARSHNSLGNLLSAVGDVAGAESGFRAASAIQERLATDNSAVHTYWQGLGGTRCNIGHFLRDTARPAEAVESYQQALAALATATRLSPSDATTKQFTRNGYVGRARALGDLSRHAEAIPDWNLAVDLSPAAQKSDFRRQRMISLMLANRHADATAEADALTKLAPDDAGLAYDAACVFSRAGQPERAVAHLRRAQALGQFKPMASILHLRRDPDLAPLRGRADFRAVVAAVEPEALPTPPRAAAR